MSQSVSTAPFGAITIYRAVLMAESALRRLRARRSVSAAPRDEIEQALHAMARRRDLQAL